MQTAMFQCWNLRGRFEPCHACGEDMVDINRFCHQHHYKGIRHLNIPVYFPSKQLCLANIENTLLLLLLHTIVVTVIVVLNHQRHRLCLVAAFLLMTHRHHVSHVIKVPSPKGWV